MGIFMNFIKLKKLNKIIKKNLSDIEIPKCGIRETEYLFIKKRMDESIDIALRPIIKSLLLDEVVTENYINNSCNAFWNHVSNNINNYLFLNNRRNETQKKALYDYINSIKDILSKSFKEIL